MRGLLDRMIGGPGLPGLWEVEKCEPDRLLLLRARMKMPGTAWLRFDVEPDDGGAVIRQTAIFDSRGLTGLLYWYFLLPIHDRMFSGMLRGIVQSARKAS